MKKEIKEEIKEEIRSNLLQAVNFIKLFSEEEGSKKWFFMLENMTSKERRDLIFTLSVIRDAVIRAEVILDMEKNAI